MEFSRLHDGITSRGGVSHKEDLVRSSGIEFSQGAFHLRELLHQVRFRVEATSSITDEKVDIQTFRLGEGVMAEGRWIGPVFAADNLDAKTLTPRFELFHGSSPKGIGGAEQDALSPGFDKGGKLRATCCFAGAVDADHQDDDRSLLRGDQVASLFGEEFSGLFTGRIEDVVGMKGEALLSQ